jgi:Ni/Co efflux regulator RcnB
MRRLINLAAAVAALAMVAPAAMAQTAPGPDDDRRDRRDRRNRDRDRDRDDNRDRRDRDDDRDRRDRRDRDRRPAPAGDPVVRGLSPEAGPPGTAVTIVGAGLPKDVIVMIGRQRVTPRATFSRRVEFDVPRRLRPGKHRVILRWEGKSITAGNFELVEGRVPDDYRPGDGPRPGPRAGDRPHRRPPRFHRERVIVSSYFPRKGAPGTKVTIRGNNFPPNTEVIVGDRPVRARVTDRRIVFTVPRGADDGFVRLRAAGVRRPIVVGRFEVAERYDPRVERRKIEVERRRKAEAYWARRQKELGRDRAKRRAWLERRERELAADRARRQAERRRALRGKWQREFLRDPETRAELALHSERIARLARMRRLAEANGSGKLVVRIEIAMDRENTRHERRMDTLKAGFKL